MISKEKDFFIAIDSDGCVFDTMEIKHKECFCPATIKHCRLQAVSKYARETWEFVNLYSSKRGVNRFPALIAMLDLLRVRPEVRTRGATVPLMGELRKWIDLETKLSNPSLYKALQEDRGLQAAYDWSEEINARIEDLVFGVPPFPLVRESLEKANERADMIVSSGTPVGALNREWGEHGLMPLVKRICGQENGTKSQHLRVSTGGQYASDHILMIGDSPGDLKAALSIGALFFPVLPGREEASWEIFHNEALDRFFDGSFAGAYQKGLIQALRDALPDQPYWAS